LAKENQSLAWDDVVKPPTAVQTNKEESSWFSAKQFLAQ